MEHNFEMMTVEEIDRLMNTRPDSWRRFSLEFHRLADMARLAATEMPTLQALADSAENDCQRAISKLQSAELALRCLEESTVDRCVWEESQRHISNLEVQNARLGKTLHNLRGVIEDRRGWEPYVHQIDVALADTATDAEVFVKHVQWELLRALLDDKKYCLDTPARDCIHRFADENGIAIPEGAHEQTK